MKYSVPKGRWDNKAQDTTKAMLNSRAWGGPESRLWGMEAQISFQGGNTKPINIKQAAHSAQKKKGKKKKLP